MDEALARLLDDIPCLSGQSREVTSLPGGLTNHNYRVRTPDLDVVVRVSPPGTQLLALDREAEHHNSVAAASVGVGAPVIDYLPGRGVLVVAFLTAFFLVFVVYVQASALFDSRRHAQELQLNRELADKAEASRFTELRSFLEGELQKLAGVRSGGSPVPADPAILARLDRLEKELLTAVEQSGNSLAAYLGEIEDRLERNAGALPPRQ